MKDSTYAQTMASLIVASTADAYNIATLHKAKLHLLDTLGVMVAGSRAPETTLIRAALGITAEHGGQSLLCGDTAMCDSRTAALVNGVAAHAYELDDSGGCDHSGAVVVPALLALTDSLSTPVRGML